ncbi:Transport protein yif1 [Mycoemilia scoparia]|uniref:Protein YIF1 n=1 Tax=Mycoemilia scoparia TaxID=417184 RepID=A0A9W8A0A0_9FUNG|nr:Transport protein yif1 [Mycoemilia scoparia]
MFGFGSNDPNTNAHLTAQLGMQFAGSAMQSVHDNVEKQVGKYVSLSMVKHYFDVTNIYVLSKIKILLFPWIHKNWYRVPKRDHTAGSVTGYQTPRYDINSPDLYIPVMALVTYVIVVGMILGSSGGFRPEALGYTASSAMVMMVFEVLVLKLACYILNIGSELLFLDLVAYSGYKFIPTIITLLLQPWGPWWLTWSCFGYATVSLAFFMIRSMRSAVIPESSSVSGINVHRKRRIHFLFFAGVMQLLYCWLLLQYKTSF